MCGRLPVKLRPVYPYYVHSVFLFLQSPGTWALWLKFGKCQLKDPGQQGSDTRCDTHTPSQARLQLPVNCSFESGVIQFERERQFVWACTVRPAELSALSYTLRVRGDVLLARIECCGASGDCGAKKLIVLDFCVGLYVTWHD